MLTAHGDEKVVARAIGAGVFGYLVKPFREEALLSSALPADLPLRWARCKFGWPG